MFILKFKPRKTDCIRIHVYMYIVQQLTNCLNIVRFFFHRNLRFNYILPSVYDIFLYIYIRVFYICTYFFFLSRYTPWYITIRIQWISTYIHMYIICTRNKKKCEANLRSYISPLYETCLISLQTKNITRKIN